MSIADEARAEAERRYPPLRPTGYSEHLTHRKHFIAGAEWQASRKPEAAPSAQHDHSGQPKVWCETHQHTHIAMIPRFTYLCKSCGFGQWYKPDAEAHEAARPGHETYEVEHVMRPIEAAPSDTDREALSGLIGAPHRNLLISADHAHTLADAILAAGFSRSQPVQVEVTDDTFTRMMSSLDRLGRETIAALIAELNEVDADIRGELGTDVASRAAATLSAALGTPAQPVQVERERVLEEVFTNLADQGWDVSMADEPGKGVSILVQPVQAEVTTAEECNNARFDLLRKLAAAEQKYADVVSLANQASRDLVAAEAMLADEREWWESIHQSHTRHLMILKDASLKRLAQSPTDALQAVKAKAWDEGYWLGINGHTGPGNPYRDSGAKPAESTPEQPEGEKP